MLSLRRRSTSRIVLLDGHAAIVLERSDALFDVPRDTRIHHWQCDAARLGHEHRRGRQSLHLSAEKNDTLAAIPRASLSRMGEILRETCVQRHENSILRRPSADEWISDLGDLCRSELLLENVSQSTLVRSREANVVHERAGDIQWKTRVTSIFVYKIFWK